MQFYQGAALKTFAEGALAGISRERILTRQLYRYLESPDDRRVCCLYGLQGTGKTVMMLQAIEHMNAFDRCLLVRCESGCSVMQIRKEIDAHPESQFLFLAEATRAQNLIGAASVLADRYAAAGKKVVLTGTESLGFFLAGLDELYGSVQFLHTTYLSFQEQHMLLGTNLADYLRYGGTLSPENVFHEAKTAGAYVDSAVVYNLVHSLEKWNQGRSSGVLAEMVRNGELPAAVRQVLRYLARQFLARACSAQGMDWAAQYSLPYAMDSDAAQRILYYLREMDVCGVLPACAGEPQYAFTQPGMQYQLACREIQTLLTRMVREQAYSPAAQHQIRQALVQAVCSRIQKERLEFAAPAEEK